MRVLLRGEIIKRLRACVKEREWDCARPVRIYNVLISDTSTTSKNLTIVLAACLWTEIQSKSNSECISTSVCTRKNKQLFYNSVKGKRKCDNRPSLLMFTTSQQLKKENILAFCVQTTSNSTPWTEGVVVFLINIFQHHLKSLIWIIIST